jgi:hypothetical protein
LAAAAPTGAKQIEPAAIKIGKRRKPRGNRKPAIVPHCRLHANSRRFQAVSQEAKPQDSSVFQRRLLTAECAPENKTPVNQGNER